MWLYFSINSPQKGQYYIFLIFTFFLLLSTFIQNSLLDLIRDHIIKTVFLNIDFLFLFKAQKSLKTCLNCVWSCVNPIFTPLRSTFHVLLIRLFKLNFSFLIKAFENINHQSVFKNHGERWKIQEKKVNIKELEFCAKNMKENKENGHMNLFLPSLLTLLGSFRVFLIGVKENHFLYHTL